MLRNRHGGNRRQPSAAIDHTTSLFVLPPNRHCGGRASSSVGSAPLRRLLLALPPSWPRSHRYPFALLGLRGAFAVSLLAVLRFPSMRPPRVSQGTMVICNVRCFFLAPLALSVPSGLGGACASSRASVVRASSSRRSANRRGRLRSLCALLRVFFLALSRSRAHAASPLSLRSGER